MAGLNHKVQGELDLCTPLRTPNSALFQNIPIRMKNPISIRNVVLITATVRNRSLAERGFMNASSCEAPGVNHSG